METLSCPSNTGGRIGGSIHELYYNVRRLHTRAHENSSVQDMYENILLRTEKIVHINWTIDGIKNIDVLTQKQLEMTSKFYSNCDVDKVHLPIAVMRT